jgi:Protein of unknown function (DUF2568)
MLIKGTLHNGNLALAFLLEVLMLAAFVFWGFQASTETLVKILLGVGVPLVVIVIWGMFLAPRSTRRLPRILSMVAELVIFGLAALALAAAGRPDLAISFAVVVIINQALLFVWKQ